MVREVQNLVGLLHAKLARYWSERDQIIDVGIGSIMESSMISCKLQIKVLGITMKKGDKQKKKRRKKEDKKKKDEKKE